MSNEHESSLRELTDVHERLCAYVLGEGTSAERADMERELMRSPELRAQHDEIARTIGLLKEAMTGAESLSPQATQVVVSAANASRPSAWKAVPWMQIAAGIGAVALGFTLVQRSSDERVGYGSRNETELADTRSSRKGGAGSFGFTEPRAATTPIDASGAVAPARSATGASADPRAEPSTLSSDSSKLDFVAGLPPAGSKNQNGVVTSTVTNDRDAGGVHDSGNAPVDVEARFGRAVPKAELGVESAHRGLDVVEQQDSTVSLKKRPEQTVMRLEETKLGRADSKSDDATAARRGDSGRPGAPTTPGVWVAGTEAAPTGSGTPTEARKSMRDAITVGGGGGGAAPDPAIAATRRLPALTSPVTSTPPAGPATSGGPAGPTGGLPGALDVPGTPKGRESLEREKAKDGRLADNEELEEQLETSDKDVAAEGFFAHDDARPAVPYYRLSPADQQAYLDRECRRILLDCRPRPDERPRDMFYRFWGDNPFEVAALDAQSTFAADVDTASYALARRYLNEGNVPEKAQIRTEEFVNYFKSDVPAPTNGVFAIHTDLTPSRFSTDTTRQMMRVVLRGKDLSKVERKPMNLTFVVDVSGSMREQNRLEMVKHAIRLLVTQLDQYDKIAIVKFSTDAQKVLGLTPVTDRAAIESAIMPLAPEGSTNSNAGLELGYGIAVGGLDPNATNRVVFLSDGVANVGETDPAKIAERVKPMREKGIYLNTIGVGMNNHNDVLLEQLADKADGVCAYIDTPEEAKKQLVDNFSGAFQPIARDVKIQVEFDPTQVLRYRLLGYENRAIADADFRNDKVDAGELGAGHQVTALYEIERQSGVGASEKPLATVRVRWKEPRNFGTNPEQDSATEISRTVSAGDAKSFEAAGQSYRKVVMAAQFAELLRRSVHARGDSLDDLLNEALKLQKEIPNDAEFNEFVLLIGKSKDLVLRSMPACDELCQAIDQVREFEYRRQQLASIQREMDQATLDALRRQNDELEARLRDLVRRRLENQVR